MKYRNNNNGVIYRYLAAGVDCTNSRNGVSVVIYCPDDNEHIINVMEADEFYQEFEPIN